MMTMTKKLKKDSLYILELEYELTTDKGDAFMVRDNVVGYVRGTEEEFFFGVCFSQEEDGRWSGGDTMTLSVHDFNEMVKSFRKLPVQNDDWDFEY